MAPRLSVFDIKQNSLIMILMMVVVVIIIMTMMMMMVIDHILHYAKVLVKGDEAHAIK